MFEVSKLDFWFGSFKLEAIYATRLINLCPWVLCFKRMSFNTSYLASDFFALDRVTHNCGYLNSILNKDLLDGL